MGCSLTLFCKLVMIVNTVFNYQERNITAKNQAAVRESTMAKREKKPREYRGVIDEIREQQHKTRDMTNKGKLE